MEASPPPVRVAALYRFTPFPDCAALRKPLLAVCKAAGVKGTILLAPEGVNGTIAGPAEAVDTVLSHIRTLPGCADIAFKESWTDEMPFHRMKVRIKREIVTMGEPDVAPHKGVGDYVTPQDWNALISDPGTIVIDTRNDYEVDVGTFANAINPATKSFRDFPAWFREHRAELLDSHRKVAMFCTGGIRCEKATALLKSEGIDQVYHLDGGILKYLETVPEDQSLWRGECFVFDQRVAVSHGLGEGSYGLCHACRMPVSVEDRQSPLYVEGISCPACHAQRSEDQRTAYAERARQMKLAEARGEAHVGAIQRK